MKKRHYSFKNMGLRLIEHVALHADMNTLEEYERDMSRVYRAVHALTGCGGNKKCPVCAVGRKEISKFKREIIKEKKEQHHGVSGEG